jgi:ribosomal protein L29
MATKKKENLKELEQGELNKKLHALREEVRVIRFKAEGSKSKNVKELWSLKKKIARVLTELNKNKNKK